MSKTEEKQDVYKCPEGHSIAAIRENYARDYSNETRDSDGEPQYESGLWCLNCNKAYGLSRLVMQ